LKFVLGVLRLFKVNGRAVRTDPGPLLAGYPPTVRRVIFWFDSLTDLQRVQYACVAILFLLACGGYLLGLGSTIVLARVEAEQSELAAQPLETLEPSPTDVPVVPTFAPTFTPVPSATPVPPTPIPSATPFTAPVIAEPPAAPRLLPAEPAAPVVVAPRATPTSKPRNLETSKPEPPAASVATSTPGLVRTGPTVVPTAVRQPPTPTPRTLTTLPTLAATVPQGRGAPTSAPTRAATVPAAPTPARTPSRG